MGKSVEIIIKRGTYAFNLPENLKKEFMEDLTFNNPKYIQAVRFGKWISPDCSKHLYFFNYDKEDDILSVPKGYTWNVIRRLKDLGIKYSIDDQTTLFPKLNIESKIELRPYQILAVQKMLKYPNGVLEASTGSGKTVMGIEIIAERKQKVLVLVHTKELLNQWVKSIKEFLSYDTGMVGDGKIIVKDITVGLIRTVQNNIEDLKDNFGFIICDETHRCPSSTFTDVLSKFSARYYLGLSATPFRSDKLDKAVFAFIGPKIHKVNTEMLHDIGAVLKPKIIRVPTNYRYHYTGEYSTMMSNLTNDIDRNRLIIETVYDDIKRNNKTILIVSDRVEHCKTLSDMLYSKGIKSAILTSKTEKNDRLAIIQGIKDGVDKVVFSTIQLIGEGFDCPNLHGIFLASPIKFNGRLLQVVGRVLRPEEGKIARVYDFRDTMVAPLQSAGMSRDKLYKKQWRK